VMIRLDIIVTDGEEGERPVRREHGVTTDDRGPRGLDRPPVRDIDIESLLPGGFPVPGEEANPDSHDGIWLRSGETDRSRSWTSRSDS
jgi:hypothetical protein